MSDNEEKGRLGTQREEHVRRCDCQEFYPMHRPDGSQFGDLTPCRRCQQPMRCDGKVNLEGGK